MYVGVRTKVLIDAQRGVRGRIIESKKERRPTIVVLAVHSSATDTRGVTADPLTRFVFGSRVSRLN